MARQTWFIASVSLAPALLLTLSFGLVIGLQVYNITRQLGAESAQGAAMALAIVREAGARYAPSASWRRARTNSW